MGIGIETTQLFHYGSRKSLLCDGLYLRAAPGTLTAIMGPSGCGKSVFLGLVTGYTRPDRGAVRVGAHDLYQDYRRIRRQIGYVPQAEIMLPELRVGTSLDFRVRFHDAWIGGKERRRRIVRTLQLLGFTGGFEYKLLDRQIGSPEWRGAYPSGGQRRKINIAHELLGSPAVLFMDEPTSGLAATDADDLIENLQRVAKEENLPIVCTIHAPSQQTFERFDDVLIMGLGGIPAFYGRRRMAVSYVRQVLGTGPAKRQNDADYILESVRNGEDAQAARDKLMECRGQSGFEYLRIPLDEDGGGGY